MRGGDQFDDIQTQLDDIKQKIADLKNTCNNSSAVATGIVEEVQQQQEEPVSESVLKSAPVVKSWQTDKTIKFKDGAGGRVSLSFDRIIQLIDGSKKSANRSNWSEIKQKLNDANSIDEVKQVIADNKLSFASGWIGGKTKKRRLVKKRSTHKRR